MSVQVTLPNQWQGFTAGTTAFEVESSSVGELFELLEARHEQLRGRIRDASGRANRFIVVYRNKEDIRYLDGLATPLTPGDHVLIQPSFQGGIEPGDAGNAKRKFYLTFPKDLIQRPLIWELIKKFDLITNLRQASVSHDIGLIALELEGPIDRIEAAQAWLEGLGVTVEPVEKTVIE